MHFLNMRCIEVQAVQTGVVLMWYPVRIYLFKANNGNTRTMCEICSKWTVKTLQQRHWNDVNNGLLVSLLLL